MAKLFGKKKKKKEEVAEKKVLGDLISVVVKEGVGKTEHSFALRYGSVVEDALREAGATPKEGAEIRLNGEPTKMSKILDDGDIITVMRKVSGAKI